MKLSEALKDKLSGILGVCIQQNLPFFSYRMPFSKEIVTGIQMSQSLKTFTSFDDLPQGFIVAPFDIGSSTESLFIQADISFNNNDILPDQIEQVINCSFELKKEETIPFEISKANYLFQANEIIDALNTNSLQKVVLSRVLNSDCSNKDQAPQLFEKLTQIYPHAFVSIFHIPGKGVWVGATPETLLLTHADGIETMSLAATKAIHSTQDWTQKERQEQQMVSDFVENVLHDFPFEEICIEGPLEQQAGNVNHLMTKYNCKGKLDAENILSLITKLHPTPAVCGIPKETVMQLIREKEQHQREYYAGYLGPVDANSQQLFVNLRCMKLTSNSVSFFVGGGITAQSKAEEEWQETCLKLETLKRIL